MNKKDTERHCLVGIDGILIGTFDNRKDAIDALQYKDGIIVPEKRHLAR